MILNLSTYDNVGSETEVGTKSDQNLATGQVLYQKHLGTAATLIKGGTQEAKFQRLLSLELHATQKGWTGAKGKGAGGAGTGHAGRRGVSARREEPCDLRLREREGRIRPGSKPAQDSPGVLALERDGKALKETVSLS